MYEDIEDIYLDVCKLSILSNLEIDRAKKEFIIDSWKELDLIRRKYKKVNSKDKTIKPNFFAHISRQKGFYNPEKKEYKKFKTSMDYLQECVNKFNSSRTDKIGRNSFLSFSEVIDKNGFYYANVYDKTIYEILTMVEKRNEYMSYIFNDNSLTSEEKYKQISDVRQEFIESIGQWDINRDTMIALLQTIEKEENKKYYRLLFYCLFGYPNTDFYKVIKESTEKFECLEISDEGDMNLYGYKFRKILQ